VSLDLTGRTVVVAGAGGGGIGTAVSVALARSGAVVAALDHDPEQLEAAEHAVAAVGGECRPYLVDLREPDAVETVIADAARTGTMYGLVHVAGGLERSQWGSLLATDPTVFDAVLGLNLHAPFLTSRAVARHLVDQAAGGSIVYITSIAGLTAMPFGAAYAAAKAGLVSLTRTAALEWGHAGIRVNAVAAGTVRTPHKSVVTATEDSAADRAAIPLGRRGDPVDVAGAALFLISDLAAYISGHVLVIDGGASARPSFVDDDNLPVVLQDPAMRAELRRDEPTPPRSGS
jgi:3-oxoacyl-[acyl-carrier protein] reductase